VRRLLLITDLDNTLYNWIDFFGPSFRAMLSSVDRSTRYGETRLYGQFREIYKYHKDPEYWRAPYELEALKSFGWDHQQKIATGALAAFSRTRRRHLKTYAGVIPTLAYLKNRDVTIVGVSNAPVREVLFRARYLGLCQYLDALIAWRGVNELDCQHAHKIATRWEIDLHTLPDAARKPDAKAYELALDVHQNYGRADVFVVGDSMQTDLLPAREIGACAIWARYGHEFSTDNFSTVAGLSFWSESKLAATYASNSLSPDIVLEEFQELPRAVLGYDRAQDDG
jgi:FMN phosphatase YigB (HAD superfamily)